MHADAILDTPWPRSAELEKTPFGQDTKRAEQLAVLWKRIEKIARTSSGQASSDMPLTPLGVIYHIKRLLGNLPDSMAVPQATASDDGEIGLTWFNRDDRLDVIASPDGHLVWASRVRGEFLDDEVLSLSSEVFGPLYKAVARFYV